MWCAHITYRHTLSNNAYNLILDICFNKNHVLPQNFGSLSLWYELEKPSGELLSLYFLFFKLFFLVVRRTLKTSVQVINSVSVWVIIVSSNLVTESNKRWLNKRNSVKGTDLTGSATEGHPRAKAFCSLTPVLSLSSQSRIRRTKTFCYSPSLSWKFPSKRHPYFSVGLGLSV